MTKAACAVSALLLALPAATSSTTFRGPNEFVRVNVAPVAGALHMPRRWIPRTAGVRLPPRGQNDPCRIGLVFSIPGAEPKLIGRLCPMAPP